jgi:hypothetical protein
MPPQPWHGTPRKRFGFMAASARLKRSKEYDREHRIHQQPSPW